MPSLPRIRSQYRHLPKSGGIGSSSVEWPFTTTGSVEALTGRSVSTISANQWHAPHPHQRPEQLRTDHFCGACHPGRRSRREPGQWLFAAARSLFSILTYGSQSGAFANVTLPPIVTWNTQYGATSYTLTVLAFNTTLPDLQVTNCRYRDPLAPVRRRYAHPVG